MPKVFNVNGLCRPEMHYMVDLRTRLEKIKEMVDAGKYFTINRSRQYGKTTTLNALADYLRKDYPVISLDFQTMDALAFENVENFVSAFSAELLDAVDSFPDDIEEKLIAFVDGTARINSLQALFMVIKSWCRKLEVPPVLMIDEVDSATNNQVFLDFLSQLRGYYFKRPRVASFQSVILAGVHDVRNLRQKIRPDEDHKHNSPWNIAADFEVDMSFSSTDIAGMLTEYENDHNTGMNIMEISRLIYDYTSGYPVLVSNICKLNDEKIDQNIKWTSEGIVKAVGNIVSSRQMLFDSMMNKLEDDENLRTCVYNILMNGNYLSYNPYDESINYALMYGFISVENGSVKIANRIFETVLYNFFLTTQKMQDTPTYKAGAFEKNQFIQNGELDMELILEKFILHFNDIYGRESDSFKENDGRKLFLLYLRPIINGVGNYYIEAQTRDQRRTDVIVDYLGKQYIIELKIWHGDEYNTRGEKQLSEYLDYYHIDKGYLLSFNFNKNKQSGVHRIELDGKTIVEAVV